MLRLFCAVFVSGVFVLAAPVCGRVDADAKEFAKDVEQLNGSWVSPKIEFSKGVTGQIQLKLEFEKNSAVGKATVPQFPSKDGVVVKGPSWTAELKQKDKKRFIVLSEKKGDKRTEVGEIVYEIDGDKLKFTSEKAIQFEKGGKSIDVSGEWGRKNEKKK